MSNERVSLCCSAKVDKVVSLEVGVSLPLVEKFSAFTENS